MKWHIRLVTRWEKLAISGTSGAISDLYTYDLETPRCTFNKRQVR